MSTATLPAPAAATRVRDEVDLVVDEFRALIEEAWTGSNTTNSARDLREQGNPMYAGILPSRKVAALAADLEINAALRGDDIVRVIAAKIRDHASAREGGNVDPVVVGRLVDAVRPR